MAELLTHLRQPSSEVENSKSTFRLSLTVLSDLDSMFRDFNPHYVELQCVLSVNKDNNNINSKIKNKGNLGSESILKLIFQKVNLN